MAGLQDVDRALREIYTPAVTEQLNYFSPTNELMKAMSGYSPLRSITRRARIRWAVRRRYDAVRRNIAKFVYPEGDIY